MFLESLSCKAITGGGLRSGEGSIFTSEQLVNLSKLKANGQHRPIWCQQDLWEREFLKIFDHPASCSEEAYTGGTHLNPPILIFYSTQQFFIAKHEQDGSLGMSGQRTCTLKNWVGLFTQHEQWHIVLHLVLFRVLSSNPSHIWCTETKRVWARKVHLAVGKKKKHSSGEHTGFSSRPHPGRAHLVWLSAARRKEGRTHEVEREASTWKQLLPLPGVQSGPADTSTRRTRVFGHMTGRKKTNSSRTQKSFFHSPCSTSNACHISGLLDKLLLFAQEWQEEWKNA